MKRHSIMGSDARVADFCKHHGIRKLSLFGSILRDDYGPDSDIDVLVEFEPDRVSGLIRLAGMEMELSKILGGRVDLTTPGFFRDDLLHHVLTSAEVEYVSG